MTVNCSALAALATAVIVLTAPAALAQEAPPPDQDVPGATAPVTVEWVSSFIASVTNEFDAMMEQFGLQSPGVELGLTPEIVAASLPVGGTADDVGFLHMDASFMFRDEKTATAPPENPQDYVLLTEPQGCVPGGNGEIIHFRTMAVEGALGHLCVVTVEDGAGVWGLRGRSLAVAGDLRVLVTYDLAVQVDGRPDRARELGETSREGAIQVSAVLAEYTLAAAAVGQNRTTDDPVEMVRRMGDVLERMVAVAVPYTSNPPTE